MCKAAVTTGARLGELIAADLEDLSLLDGKLEIRRHWDRVDGATLPKDSEPRTVYLIPPARAVLEAWLTVRGTEPGPLFPAPRGERVNGQYLTKLIGAAMDAAGILREAANGKRRKPFHAFRACFARLCREQGADAQWVQAMLGHSTVELTIGVYGKWADEAQAAAAARVPSEAFPV
jgi:integrase